MGSSCRDDDPDPPDKIGNSSDDVWYPLRRIVSLAGKRHWLRF